MAKKFTAVDGTEFTDRKSWRVYMMDLLSFKDVKDTTEPKIKSMIDGNDFSMMNCENATLAVCDISEQVQIDDMKNCTIFVGACQSSIFARNCTHCKFYTYCRQLRLRDCTDCTLYVYSQSEVHIEDSTRLKFGPSNSGYLGQAEHLQKARLDTSYNLWYDIYDHNDTGKTKENWCIIPESEWEEPWFPLTPCEPAVPRTKIGSVVKSSEPDSNMDVHNLEAMKAEAEKQKQAALATAPVAPIPSTTPVDVLPPAIPTKSPTKPATSSPNRTATISNTASDTSDIEKIIGLMNNFSTFTAGGDYAAICTDDFKLLLNNGKCLSAQDFGLVASITASTLYAYSNISISMDLAYSTFYIQEGASDVVACTGVFKKVYSEWRIAHVQKSTALAKEDWPSK